ncbi:MAG: NAD(P)H-hydrate dehydratase, partial [Clostridia bacterium]|nr:NAD(P)H-hydrate dehydratase [Clostridia bacterium]
GLGNPPWSSRLLERLCETNLPQVWDADALNWLAKNPRKLPGGSVITPHPGEAARLLRLGTRDVVREPVAAAAQLFADYGATALLKGATTVIAYGERRALDVSGSPGMATGGAGDVLTGLIAALIAQGIEGFNAARLGALLHGRAGERAAASRGVRSMAATDILDFLRID